MLPKEQFDPVPYRLSVDVPLSSVKEVSVPAVTAIVYAVTVLEPSVRVFDDAPLVVRMAAKGPVDSVRL